MLTLAALIRLDHLVPEERGGEDRKKKTRRIGVSATGRKREDKEAWAAHIDADWVCVVLFCSYSQ